MTTRAQRVRARGTTTTNGRNNTQTPVETVEEVAPVMPVTPVQTRSNFATICKEYQTLGGKVFKGTESFIEVQAWLRSCERIFKGQNLNDEQKRLLASWQLQGAAAIWWDAQMANVSENDFSWGKFKEEFEAQFLPTAGKTRMYRDFIDLKQGNMSIVEYENKFNALSCFGPDLINTSSKRTRCSLLD